MSVLTERTLRFRRHVPCFTILLLDQRNSKAKHANTLQYHTFVDEARTTHTATMADEDDLDAFFDEVSEVEAQVVEETEKQAPATTEDATKPPEKEEPPAKRQKTVAPTRPKGVVVASSTSVVMAAKEREEKVAQAEKMAREELEQLQQQQQQQQQQRYQPSIGPIGPVGPHAGPPPMGAGGGSIGPYFPGAAMPPPPADANNPPAAKKKPVVRMAAGTKWVDKSLEEWPENDYRIFVGNLSNEVTDEMLHQHFSAYPSLARVKVVRHAKEPDKSKGFGFVSMLDPLECAKAIRQMDQTWLASRPIRVKRSDWKDRDFKTVKKKQRKEHKEQKRKGLRF